MVESDSNLVDFFSKCDVFELLTLLKAMKSHYSPFSKKLVKRYPTENDIPNANTPERMELSNEMLQLLQWYGSNAVAYGWRKVTVRRGGCHYHKILRDVAKRLNHCQKRKDRKELPKVDSVDGWESRICSLLLASAIKGKTSQEIAIMFEEAGLDAEAARTAAMHFVSGAVVGISLPIAVNILGKKTVTILVKEIIIHLTYKRVGKEAATQMAKRLLLTTPQKVFAKIISGIGWLLLAIDSALFLSSPARRVTIPVVSMISALRSLDRLKNLNEE